MTDEEYQHRNAIAAKLRDQVDMTARLDDAFGKRREGESVHHWQEREKAWRGTPSQAAVEAGNAEKYQRDHAKHMARVQAERDKVKAEAEAKRAAEVQVARAAFEAHKARTADDEALAFYRAQQAKAANPGRV